MRFFELLGEAAKPDPRSFGTISTGPGLYIHYAHTDAQIRSIVQNGFDLSKFKYTAKKVRMPELAQNDPKGVFALAFEPGDRVADRPHVIFRITPAPNVLGRLQADQRRYLGYSEDLKTELAQAYGKTGAALSAILLRAGIQVVHSTSEYIILDPSRIEIVRTSIPGLLAEDVWHGTHSRFDQFSTDFMSSGEGNQTYGWGLYFTDKREIAQHYQRTVSAQHAGLVLPDGTRQPVAQFVANALTPAQAALRVVGYADVADYLDDLLRGSGTIEQALTEARHTAQEASPRHRPFYAAAASVLAAMVAQGASMGASGHLYRVEIPDGPYLDWDKPLVAQPGALGPLVTTLILPRVEFEPSEEGVLAIAPGRPGLRFTASGRTETAAIAALYRSPLFTGEYVYKALSTILRGDRAASLLLAKHGIPGLRYLAGSARMGGGDHASNYVIFDDASTTVRTVHEDVFHGTPHGFERFSLDRIGTGEGAQVYGWGLYFAGDQDVAEFYRTKLTQTEEGRSTRFTLDGHPIDPTRPENEMPPIERAAFAVHAERMNQREAIRNLEEGLAQRARMTPASVESEAYRMDQETLAVLKSEDLTGRIESFDGFMYRVLLPDTEDWLLWDEPLAGQSAVVRDALSNLGVSGSIAGDLRWRKRGSVGQEYGFDHGHRFVVIGEVTMRDGRFEAHVDGAYSAFSDEGAAVQAVEQQAATLVTQDGFVREHHLGGEHAYKALAKHLGSDKNASVALALKGVAGVKYLDGDSRQGLKYEGEETYNYVLFDDKNATIMKRELVKAWGSF